MYSIITECTLGVGMKSGAGDSVQSVCILCDPPPAFTMGKGTSMPRLQPMPPITIPTATLLPFGNQWAENGEKLSRSRPWSSIELGVAIDARVAEAHSVMLGGIPIRAPTRTSLLPPESDCVECGEVRIVGGVRPQNFDLGYRPDGIRIAYDSKTLNDLGSIGKNWNNMVNDLGTEAVTVHTRFPHALVEFLVAIPKPVFEGHRQSQALIGTLGRLARREHPTDESYLAEAIALVIWDPTTGVIDQDCVPVELRLATFSQRVERLYHLRYQGLPPHQE
jgi:hypothetical protein